MPHASEREVVRSKVVGGDEELYAVSTWSLPPKSVSHIAHGGSDILTGGVTVRTVQGGQPPSVRDAGSLSQRAPGSTKPIGACVG
jgi:hypothetical protein